jgi:hypothetical protein
MGLVYWSGTEPHNCQICHDPFRGVMIDASIRGRWGLVCETCHKKYGNGLGVGRGQKYTQDKSGRWIKTAG